MESTSESPNETSSERLNDTAIGNSKVENGDLYRPTLTSGMDSSTLQSRRNKSSQSLMDTFIGRERNDPPTLDRLLSMGFSLDDIACVKSTSFRKSTSMKELTSHALQQAEQITSNVNFSCTIPKPRPTHGKADKKDDDKEGRPEYSSCLPQSSLPEIQTLQEEKCSAGDYF
jgi:hypothetical protein